MKPAGINHGNKAGNASFSSGMLNHEHAKNIVMVCVTRQRTCERLIARGGEIAAEYEVPLHVVHAVRTHENFLGDPSEGNALEYLFTAARLSGGVLTVLRTDSVEEMIEEYARVHKARAIVLGASPVIDGSDFAARLNKNLGEIEVVIV
jgi:K+-sensing histidine kinase KdpD